MANIKCTGCSVGLTGQGFVRFECPNCCKVEIVRCQACRKNGRAYACPACGYEGP